MMEPRTTIPLDILACIIDLLADEGNRDTKSLQILSQTCKSLLPLCRRHLFSSLQLHRQWQSERFSDLLSRCPDIVRYVKSLIFAVGDPVTDHELKILDLLKNRSPCLQSIELLSYYNGFNWSELSESMQTSLVFLIQLPTVTCLDIHAFKGFPSTALALCTNLIDLQIQALTIAPPDACHNTTRSKIPTPASLYTKTKSYHALAVLMASIDFHTIGPIIDFSRLQKASFDLDSPGDIVQIAQLIRTTSEIQSLDISLHRPVGLAGFGQSLTVNAYRTLTFLAVTFTVIGDDYDPLCGLNRELRFIAEKNILEEFELAIVVQTDASCKTESEDWSTIDSVLTDSGAFPMLHRVSVDIWWFSYGRGLDEVDAILASLTKERFVRLVESTTVEFVFHADDNDI